MRLDTDMKIYKGKTGLGQTFQDNFKETMKCYKCGGNCRIMFVACENEREGKGKFIADFHDGEDDKMWVHDACAVAVYLCEECFEPNAEINQA